MAVTGSTELGNGLCVHTVDADPRATAVDAPCGSILIYVGTDSASIRNGDTFRKLDDGSTTNVSEFSLKNNYAATTNPGTGNDNTQGYQISSRWINITLDKEFVCLDASTGAAVWVETTGAGGGGESDHGALTGLGDDDHSIYALLAGRSGGQTIIGGADAGEDLILQSTSHATRGVVKVAAGDTLQVDGNLDLGADATSARILTDITGGTTVRMRFLPRSGNRIMNFIMSPSGSQDESRIQVRNKDDTSNYGYMTLSLNGSLAQLQTGKVGSGVLPSRFKFLVAEMRLSSVLKIEERAAAVSDTAGNGQIWVKNTIPNQLWFTDDTGVDTQLGVGSGVTDHGALTGLSDDDHSIYALLLGRATGQTVIGGIAAGEDLKLQSTSHATRGSIFFGSALTTLYDEVNDRFGIGKAVPVSALHVLRTSDVANADQIVSRFENDGSQNQVRVAWVVPSDTSANARLFGMQLYATSSGCGWADYEARPLRFYTGASPASATQRLKIQADGKILIGSTGSAVTDLTIRGTMTLLEQAAADGDTAGYGQLWAKNDAPTSLMFTGDNGIDVPLTPRYSTISASSDAVPLAGVTVLGVNTAGGTVRIGGFTGGALPGTVVYIIKLSASNDLILEYFESTGTQKMITDAAADVVLSGYGGVTIIWNGTYWWVLE